MKNLSARIHKFPKLGISDGQKTSSRSSDIKKGYSHRGTHGATKKLMLGDGD